jgi:hypothetical protein
VLDSVVLPGLGLTFVLLGACRAADGLQPGVSDCYLLHAHLCFESDVQTLLLGWQLLNPQFYMCATVLLWLQGC